MSEIKIKLSSDLYILKVDSSNIDEFASILTEAANWLISENKENWDPLKFTIENIQENNNLDELYLCYVGKEAIGCFKLQESDEMFWPDDMHGEALYLHKLAVRRKYAGQGVSAYILSWAKAKVKEKGSKYLRLDCLTNREKLCRVYENQEFVKVEERLVFGEVKSALYEFKI